MAIHAIQAIKIGTTLIDGIQNSSFSPGLDVAMVTGDSDPYMKFAAVMEQKPTIRFSTTKIATAIAACGIEGCAIDDDGDPDTTFQMWLVALKDDDTRETTGIKVEVIKGILIPRTLSGRQGNQPATIEYELLLGGEDLGAVPFTSTAAQTVPTGIDQDEVFSIGEVVVNGTVIGDITDISHDFGITAEAVMGTGQVFPRFVTLRQAMPKTTFSTYNVDSLTTVTVDGVSIGASAVQLYFTECDLRGTRKATGIEVEITDGIVMPRRLNGQQGQGISIQYEIFAGGTADSASPYAITSSVSIPTDESVTPSRHTIGEVSVNSVNIGGIQSVDLDFGIEAQQVMQDGDVYPAVCNILSINPSATIETVESSGIGSYDEGDNHAVVINLKKEEEFGARSDEGAKTLTTYESIISLEEIGGNANQNATMRMMVRPTHDGTHAPFTFA